MRSLSSRSTSAPVWAVTLTATELADDATFAGALAGFRKIDDLLCYRLLDVIGAVPGPQADADYFERDTKDARRFLIEIFTV